MFNVLCEHPETVAEYLVPRVRATEGTGAYHRFLTPVSIAHRALTFVQRRHRFFDADGTPKYAGEKQRVEDLREKRAAAVVAGGREEAPAPFAFAAAPVADAAKVSGALVFASLMLTTMLPH